MAPRNDIKEEHIDYRNKGLPRHFVPRNDRAIPKCYAYKQYSIKLVIRALSMHFQLENWQIGKLDNKQRTKRSFFYANAK